jgi:hypothetical protein
MKPPRIGPFPELAAYLEGKSGLITRRWLRAVRSDPAIEPAGRLTTGQLVDHLPSLYEEICSVLRTEQMTLARLYSDARKHGRDRWMRGYQLDELFRELDQFQRCVQRATREFFANTPALRNAQAAAHQLLEDLFSATILTAIRQMIDEQDGRISATIDERDRALAAQQKSEERLRMAASAGGPGYFRVECPNAGGRLGKQKDV